MKLQRNMAGNMPETCPSDIGQDVMPHSSSKLSQGVAIEIRN